MSIFSRRLPHDLAYEGLCFHYFSHKFVCIAQLFNGNAYVFAQNHLDTPCLKKFNFLADDWSIKNSWIRHVRDILRKNEHKKRDGQAFILSIPYVFLFPFQLLYAGSTTLAVVFIQPFCSVPLFQ